MYSQSRYVYPLYIFCVLESLRKMYFLLYKNVINLYKRDKCRKRYIKFVFREKIHVHLCDNTNSFNIPTLYKNFFIKELDSLNNYIINVLCA